MNARWQQTLVLLQCSALLAWLAWAWPRSPLLAGAGLLLAALWTLLWLALPFALMQRVNRRHGAPALTRAQLLHAWWREVGAVLWVFGWLQPFRAQAEPDHLPSAAPTRGVLLLHGFMCNRGLWNPWLRALRARARPCMALTLEPAFGSIDDYSDAIEAAVQQLERCSGGRAPLIVGHSMGGLAMRAWLRAYPERAALPLDLVTLGTPHHGTWSARLSHLRNGRQMRQASAWLQALAAAEEARPATAARWHCWYSNGDNIVFPAGTAARPGAENHLLAGVGHVRLVYEPAVFAACMALL